jgi:tyrosine-protein phosphatase YwqE
MMSFFKSIGKSQEAKATLLADMHAHFLPGIDDGASDLKESLLIIEKLIELGYKKLLATPHIMHDFYKNTPDIIEAKLEEVKQAVAQQGWQVELGAAAEYYLDEWFVEKLKKGEPLLSFGNNYVLFETSFINQPVHLQEAIFLMQSLNYKPVLAHPERYIYLQDNFNKCVELLQHGVLLQINITSLTGYYSIPAQLLAERLIDTKMVHFAGTDTHAVKHLKALQQAQTKKYYARLLEAELLNYSL